MQISDFENMEPMKYYDNPMPKTVSAQQKRLDIISGELSKSYIGTRKFDGDWGCFIHYSRGHNLIRSRAKSKLTGKYGDYTQKLPALTSVMDFWPDNTVILGELCLAAPHQTANTIGTILRCLTDKAIERQKQTPVEVHTFDILRLNGEDLTSLPYEERLNQLNQFQFRPVSCFRRNPFNYPIIFDDNFAQNADEVISTGGEGLVLQLRSNPYRPGTRTAWKTLKLKQTLPHLELKVIDTLEPNKLYEGGCLGTWKYWEVDDIMCTTLPPQMISSCHRTNGGADPTWKRQGYSYRAITKPYFMHWKNGIVVDYDGVKVSVSSGLTDDDMEWLSTREAAAMIKSGGLYAEVKAMSVNSQNSLRHPCLVQLRPDYDGPAQKQTKKEIIIDV